MRLIDADELKELICNNVYPVQDAFNTQDYGMFWTGGIEKGIDEAPTIDAEPVRHGHWIYCRDRYADHKQYQCSVCGKHMWSKEKYIKDEKYCFNCGAKMEEDEE